MISIYVHRNGETCSAPRVEPAWLEPGADLTLWVDLSAPGAEEGRLLSDVFRFHPLSVEDALSAIHHPKVEPYPGYLYLILHGIDFEGRHRGFATRDIDFFLGRNYLVTVHDGRSRSIAKWKQVCDRHEHALAEGPSALLHRIVDTMVENYRPARREFSQINDEITYRFRDVYDHFVRMSEEAALFQDRMTSILEAHLSAVSNRLNVIVKVLTVISTIFLPLTVLTGMWGMNVPLPMFPGGDAAQFWWVAAMMGAIAFGMLAVLRWKKWM